MGLKTNFNPELLAAQIRQIGEKAVRGVSDIMKEEGKMIQEIAKDNAPIDDGHLQDAIEYIEERGAKNRIQVTVFVDMDRPAEDGKTVGDYALIMEEGLAPYGSGGAGNLGPLSQAKAAGGSDVGGKYMQRAFQKRAIACWSRAQALVKRMLK